MEDKKLSPAIEIFKKIMRHQGHQMGRSHLRVDYCKAAAIHLAVMYGIEFYEDDFFNENAGWYAKHSDVPAPQEDWYAIACGASRENHNKSAALAMEKRWNRKPYLLRNPSAKTPTRVYVGRRFDWFAGTYLTCSGFRAGYFIAQWRKLVKRENDRWDRWDDKLIKTLKITHADIKLYHKYLDGKLSEKETAELRKKYAFVEKLKPKNELGGEK